MDPTSSPNPMSMTISTNTSLVRGEMEAFNQQTNQLNCLNTGTCYIVDVSTWLSPLSFTIPILGVFFPILTLLTTVANSIIIHILLRPAMRSPTNILLAAIAVFDMATLLIQAPWHIYVYTIGMHSSTHWSITSCYLLELFTQTLPQVCHTTANWLTMGLSAQRYIYICQPHLAKQWCSVRRSYIGVAIAFSLAVAHIVTRTFDRSYQAGHFDSKDVCVVGFASWVNAISLDIYFNCFFWLRVIFVQCIPCLFVTIFNGYLLNALKKAQKIQAGLLTKSLTVRKTNRTTYMLIILNAVFLLVEVPLSVLTVLYTISSSVYEFLDYAIVNKLVLFFNLLIILSYPVNFGIYCSLSSQFLAALKSLLSDTLRKLCSQDAGSPTVSYHRCNSQTQNTTI